MLSRAKLPLILLMLVVGFTMLSLSVMRYRAYNARMLDLGNMSQAIWSAGHGYPLEYTPETGSAVSLSRLAWHVELIYFLIAPIYRLFPSPITLLVLQTALFALGAFPLYSMALRHLDSSPAATAVAAIYLFYPVAHTALLWDFHGDTLAMPLLIFALEALDREAWPAYVLWLALSLASKVYVAVPVTALGVALWLRGRPRVGQFTAFAGIAWGVVAFFVIRPLFAVQSLTSSVGNYTVFYFGSMLKALGETLVPRTRVAMIVFLPVFPFAFRRRALPWMLPALAVGVPVLASNGPGPSFSYVYHHYALTVPFSMMAILEGAAVVSARRRRVFRRLVPDRGLSAYPLYLALSLSLTLGLNSTFVDGPLNRSFWFGPSASVRNELRYHRTLRDSLKDELVSNYIPPHAPLGASTLIAPHVANRSTLFTSYNLEGNLAHIDYAIFDGLFDYVIELNAGNHLGGVLYDTAAIRMLLRSPEFDAFASRDGLLLFARDVAPEQALYYNVELIRNTVLESPRSQVDFDGAVALVEAEALPLETRRFRLRFDWRLLRSLSQDAPLFAVSRVRGWEGDRFPHIPTEVLLPTPSWPVDAVIREEFDIELPSELPQGEYCLETAWYDSGHPYAFATDARSQVGEPMCTLMITVSSGE